MKNAKEIVEIIYKVQAGVVKEVGEMKVGENEKGLILKGKIAILSEILQKIKD